jgi:heme exporter protein B
VSGPNVALAVLSKDLLLDLRSRDRLGHMAIFAALVIVLISIALPSSNPALKGLIPVLLWVVFLFTALLGLGRSFAAETEEGGLVLLARVPCDRGWVFLGKAAANWITLVGVQLWTAVLATVFLDVRWGDAALVSLGVAVLGALGLAAVGTLLAALSTSARFREFLLPVLLFPLILPVLVLGSRMTGEALAGRVFPGMWWGALVLYDWAFALIAYFVFDYVLED